MEQVHQIRECDHVPNPTERHLPSFGKGIEKLKEKGQELKGQLQAAHDVAEERADKIVSRSSMLGKKGNFNMLSDTAKSLVVFGIMLVLGVAIIVGVRDTFTADSSEYNEADAILALFTDLRTWAAIVLLVIIAYVILRYLGIFDKQ